LPKRMKIDFKDQWPELIAVFLLVLGFLFSISMPNPFYTYIVIFIAGLFAGRYFFSKIGKQMLFPFFLIIIGFLLGYTMGSISADRRVVLILFALAWYISHKAHKEGIVKI